jgi:hypothetical protein
MTTVPTARDGDRASGRGPTAAARRIRAFAAGAAALALLAGGGVSSQRQAETFDDSAVGRPPQRLALIPEPGADGSPWQIAREGANHVLTHSSRSGGSTDYATVKDLALSDVALSVRVRFPGAAEAAGLAWRFRDVENHYLASLDLRAQRVRIYRVAGGTRTRLESEDDLELDPAAWHTVKVEHVGTRVRVWIDGVPAADATDRASATPGAIGVWTPADALVWFDELRVEPRTRR